MSKEDDLLDDIFGQDRTWRGYKVSWCDHCNVYIIGCKDPNCYGSSCNGMGCDKCVQDHLDFHKLHPWPEYYMTEQEKRTVEKYYRIKHHLRRNIIEDGTGFNLQKALEGGWLSPSEEDLFEIEPKSDSYNEFQARRQTIGAEVDPIMPVRLPEGIKFNEADTQKEIEAASKTSKARELAIKLSEKLLK